MWSTLGKIAVGVALPLVMEQLVKKTGIWDAVVDTFSDAGKVGSGQESKKKSAIDDLDLSKADKETKPLEDDPDWQ